MYVIARRAVVIHKRQVVLQMGIPEWVTVGQKHTGGELENDIYVHVPENCARTHRLSLHILSKNLTENVLTTNKWLPFLPSQLVLGQHKVILAKNVPCLEKKRLLQANPLSSFH